MTLSPEWRGEDGRRYMIHHTELGDNGKGTGQRRWYRHIDELSSDGECIGRSVVAVGDGFLEKTGGMLCWDSEARRYVVVAS